MTTRWLLAAPMPVVSVRVLAMTVLLSGSLVPSYSQISAFFDSRRGRHISSPELENDFITSRLRFRYPGEEASSLSDDCLFATSSTSAAISGRHPGTSALSGRKQIFQFRRYACRYYHRLERITIDAVDPTLQRSFAGSSLSLQALGQRRGLESR
jgi:hypothetical protein